MKFGWIIYSRAAPGYLRSEGSNTYTVADRNRAQVYTQYPEWEKAPTRDIIPVAIEEIIEISVMSQHHVVYGECLSAICYRAGVHIDDVVKINNIENRGQIQVGQVLILPPRGFRLC